MKIVLFGPPASGRGSHRVRVKERYPLLCYANPHDLLRQEIRSKTQFGTHAQALLSSGTPVPDDDMMDLVLKFIKSPACSAGWILEGLPRTAEQAEQLVKETKRIDAVVELDVSDATVLQRTSGRLVHRPSGRIYHASFAPPKVPGKDDVTGEPLTTRLDDDVKVATERLSRYRSNIAAIKRFFAGQNPYDDSQHDPSLPDSEPAPAPAAGATAPPKREWQFPTRLPVVRRVDGEGTAEDVRTRLFQTLDEVAGKRATGPHQQRFWWSWFS